MDDLISRAAALDAIDGMKPMQGNMEQLAMKALCWAAVKTIQPVDAAPVVRCRDCTAWETDWKPNHSMDDEYFCPMVGFVTSKDWFCGYGEQREGK